MKMTCKVWGKEEMEKLPWMLIHNQRKRSRTKKSGVCGWVAVKKAEWLSIFSDLSLYVRFGVIIQQFLIPRMKELSYSRRSFLGWMHWVSAELIPLKMPKTTSDLAELPADTILKTSPRWHTVQNTPSITIIQKYLSIDHSWTTMKIVVII